jgi:Fe2+ transport system protein FeoA
VNPAQPPSVTVDSTAQCEPQAAPGNLPSAASRTSAILSQIGHGCVARVHSLDAPGEDAARLKSMGICAGRRVQLVQAGDPLIVRVLGARVGISARLAAQIRVTEVES